MIAARAQGDLVLQGRVLTGWCWASDRPRERLRVVITLDGTSIGSVLASRLRLDLVRAGACDGYHGFAIPLPSGVNRFAVAEAVDAATGYVFARILRGIAEDRGRIARMDELADTFSAMHDALQDGGVPALKGHTARNIIVPFVVDPVFSLLFEDGDLSETIGDIAPVLSRRKAEVLIVRSPHDPPSAGLSHVTGLHYVDSLETNRVDRINEAVSRFARGRVIGLLKRDRISAVRLTRLLAWLPEPGIGFVQGVSQAVSSLPAGERAAALVALRPPGSGSLLLISRAIYNSLGGLSAVADLGGGSVEEDFLGRARANGYTVTLTA